MRKVLNAIDRFVPSMLKGLGQGIYDTLPISLRYGRTYRTALRFLNQSQYFSIEEHRNYQYRMLSRLLCHAFANVPFYRELFKMHRIMPEDIQQLEDLRFLPTITKEDLRNHLEEMRCTSYGSSKFQYHTTGGSTGHPVGLYWETDRTVPLERAFMTRQFGWVGYRLGKDRAVVLRGIPPRNGKLFERIADNQVRLSVYELTEENLKHFVELIRRFDPVAIHGYPSAVFILARYILDKNPIKFPSLRVVLCGSENLYQWQRDTIASAFNCRVYSWYGQSEYISLGGECEHSTNYHFYTEYGITEFLRPDGTPAAPGEQGEIVATGFNNFAMPLIRYRMEDLATLSKQTTCECGRHYPLVQRVDGRLQEMIVSRQGNLIPMTAVNMHNDIFDNVIQFQFYQSVPGKIIMKIIPKPQYSDQDTKRIHYALNEKLKGQFEINIALVKEIPPTSRGKHRFLIQDLPINLNELSSGS